ncbi:hypothetical protein KIN20_001702 [Parelaphostrongylus tenuis]|uniref:Uncharacterized protein n=1 Tax=Parelaphostrongylus tenuis TaxID=148309 RepID=A0AAD5LYR3_PARTN|nr:hypothetical protein KIN20_001702 [Parelaphostrongylus tenuis]
MNGSLCYCGGKIQPVNLIFVALWCSACMDCLVLVINCLLDESNKEMVQMVFGGNRTYLALLIPLVYFLCFALFTPPLLFNSNHMAWYFVTFTPNADTKQFHNYPNTANNLFMVITTCPLCIKYSKELLRDYKIINRLTWAHKSVLLVSTDVSILTSPNESHSLETKESYNARYCSVMEWLIKANGNAEKISNYDCEWGQQRDKQLKSIGLNQSGSKKIKRGETGSDRKAGYVNIWLGISSILYGLVAEASPQLQCCCSKTTPPTEALHSGRVPLVMNSTRCNNERTDPENGLCEPPTWVYLTL